MARRTAEFCFSQKKAEEMLSSLALSPYRFFLEDALSTTWKVFKTDESKRKEVTERSAIKNATLQRLRVYAHAYKVKGRYDMSKKELLILVLEAFEKDRDDAKKGSASVG